METWSTMFAKIKTTIINTDFWLDIGWVVFKIVLILVLANVAIRVGNVSGRTRILRYETGSRRWIDG